MLDFFTGLKLRKNEFAPEFIADKPSYNTLGMELSPEERDDLKSGVAAIAKEVGAMGSENLEKAHDFWFSMCAAVNNGNVDKTTGNYAAAAFEAITSEMNARKEGLNSAIEQGEGARAKSSRETEGRSKQRRPSF